MRCYNCLLCPKISVVLWLALLVLVSPAHGQTSNIQANRRVAAYIVSDSPEVANRVLHSNAAGLKFAEFSEGISIAKHRSARSAERHASTSRRRSTVYSNRPSTLTSTPGSATSDRNPAKPTQVELAPPAVPPAASVLDNKSSNIHPPAAPLAADTDAAYLAGLTRPLHSVNLADAATAESLAGEQLRQPTAINDNFQFNAGTILDSNRSLTTPLPWRVSQPVWYNPLYVEDPNLERCGQHHGIFTEPVSLVKFFGRMPVVPYMVASYPPNSCVRSLGDCPTCHSFGIDAYLPPLDAEASAVQAAATVGLIFLIP